MEDLKSDKEIAELFDLTPQEFSRRKKRGTLLAKIIDWGICQSADLNWLLTGEGSPYVGQQRHSSNVLDIKHNCVIQEFDDKEFAIEVNEALVALEKASTKNFYEIGGYIKRAAQEAKQKHSVDDETRLTGTEDTAKK